MKCEGGSLATLAEISQAFFRILKFQIQQEGDDLGEHISSLKSGMARERYARCIESELSVAAWSTLCSVGFSSASLSARNGLDSHLWEVHASYWSAKTTIFRKWSCTGVEGVTLPKTLLSCSGISICTKILKPQWSSKYAMPQAYSGPLCEYSFTFLSRRDSPDQGSGLLSEMEKADAIQDLRDSLHDVQVGISWLSELIPLHGAFATSES